MQFKSGATKPKATLEIGTKTYELKSPTVGQTNALMTALEDNDSTKDKGLLMRKFICDLGKIPLDELDKIEQELFNQLFEHMVSSKKN